MLPTSVFLQKAPHRDLPWKPSRRTRVVQPGGVGVHRVNPAPEATEEDPSVPGLAGTWLHFFLSNRDTYARTHTQAHIECSTTFKE